MAAKWGVVALTFADSGCSEFNVTTDLAEDGLEIYGELGLAKA